MVPALLGFAGCILLATSSVAATKSPNQQHLRFKGLGDYVLAEPPAVRARPGDLPEWISAFPRRGDTNTVQFGSRIVVQTISNMPPEKITSATGLMVLRQPAANVFILQASDAVTAAARAGDFALLPFVSASYPVIRKHTPPHGPYAPLPSDGLFGLQWQLEHRAATGASAGVDLNTREAWPVTHGEGVTIAVADTGIDMSHPELLSRLAGSPHYNFDKQTNLAGPVSTTALGAHGTEVAGLAAASLNNNRMSGVAPGAKLASWVIYQPSYATVSDDVLMDAYQYQAENVAVQNHSWGHVGLRQNAATVLEAIGISNAVNHGRSGRGVVMVRSAGNDRSTGANANDDMYANDPAVITVAAVREDGRVTSYSEPGACVLVAAPSGDPSLGFQGLLSTDLVGTQGANQISFWEPNRDLSDYVFNSFGFSGTSASTPLISGVTALILSANQQLTARDVQQILAAASRQFDFADPDLATNGAGFLVSHNTGFGVPDAGEAVRLAKSWPVRSPLTRVSYPMEPSAEIPDDGLRLLVSGDNIPAEISSITNLPAGGPHPDSPTPVLPLVWVGYGTNYSGISLSNKAALIQRGGGPFANSLMLAAQAGAAFAVVYNFATNSDPSTAPGGDQLMPMGATDMVPIPAVFIGHSAGAALTNIVTTNATARAQLRLNSTNLQFHATQPFCVHNVGLRVTTDHPLRGDLRITLLSPAGTRSVLQRYNGDVNPGPTNWVYWSRLHLGESGAGVWSAQVSDEAGGATGQILGLELMLEGNSIADTDSDGLDDTWELDHFKNLANGSKDDPDRDGANNFREWLVGSNPENAEAIPPVLDLSRWNSSNWRLSWAGSPAFDYEIMAGTNPASLQSVGTISGSFPTTEWFKSSSTNGFFGVKAKLR